MWNKLLALLTTSSDSCMLQVVPTSLISLARNKLLQDWRQQAWWNENTVTTCSQTCYKRGFYVCRYVLKLFIHPFLQLSQRGFLELGEAEKFGLPDCRDPPLQHLLPKNNRRLSVRHSTWCEDHLRNRRRQLFLRW